MTNWITVPNARPAGMSGLSTPRATVNFGNATISFNKKATEQLIGPLGPQVVLMVDPETSTIGIRKAHDYESAEIKRKVYGHSIGSKAVAISIHSALRMLGMRNRIGSEQVVPNLVDGLVTLTFPSMARPSAVRTATIKQPRTKLRRISVAA